MSLPSRSRARAVLAQLNGKVSVVTLIGICGAKVEKFLGIAPRKIRHRNQAFFTPENIVRKSRDFAHVYPSAYHDPARTDSPQGGRHQCANRSKDHHRIQRFRRWHIGTASPDRAHFECEILCSGIAWGGEREQCPPLVPQDLSHDVGSSAKTINANLFGVAGHLQRSITDQSGAQ